MRTHLDAVFCDGFSSLTVTKIHKQAVDVSTHLYLLCFRKLLKAENEVNVAPNKMATCNAYVTSETFKN